MPYLRIIKNNKAVKINPREPIFRADYGLSAWYIYNLTCSKNFGKVRGKRHPFRLLDKKGKIRFRGYNVFPDRANYEALLRPLNDFGLQRGCCDIAYKVGPKYRTIPLYEAIKFALLKPLYNFDVREFLDMYDLHSLTEADEEQLQNYIEYISEP